MDKPKLYNVMIHVNVDEIFEHEVEANSKEEAINQAKTLTEYEVFPKFKLYDIGETNDHP